MELSKLNIGSRNKEYKVWAKKPKTMFSEDNEHSWPFVLLPSGELKVFDGERLVGTEGIIVLERIPQDDRKNNKAFEGDVVNVAVGDHPRGGVCYHSTVGVIVWDKNSYKIAVWYMQHIRPTMYEFKQFVEHAVTSFEVIGNVFEDGYEKQIAPR